MADNQTTGDLAVTTQTASSSATRAFPKPPLPVLAGSSMLVMALLLYNLYIRAENSSDEGDTENGIAERRATLAKQGAERVSTISHQAAETLSAVRAKMGFPDTAPEENPEQNDKRDELKATMRDTGAALGSLVKSGMSADEPPAPEDIYRTSDVDTNKTSREAEAAPWRLTNKTTPSREHPLSVPPEDPGQKLFGAFQVERPTPEPVVPDELDPKYVKQTLMTDDAENPAKSPKRAD